MEVRTWTSLHAFTPRPRPCSCCGAPILVVKKIDDTPITGCPRCDYLYRLHTITEETL